MNTLYFGIDGNEANVANRVGSNVYAFELIKHLEMLTRNKPEYVFKVFLTDFPREDMPVNRPGWEYHQIKPKKLATQWGLPLTLFTQRKNIDLFFTPGHYAPRLCPVPYISSVMDLGYLHFPRQFKLNDYWQLKLWTEYSVKKAKHVIAISEFTKQDVVNTYRVKNDKVSIVYPAMNVLPLKKENQKARQEIFHKLGIHHPYILYVGTLQPRKNIVRLIDAFEKLMLNYQSEIKRQQNQTKHKKKKQNTSEQTQKEIILILAGKAGWLADPILNRIKNSPFKSHILLTGFVSEEEKALLYKHAMCTVLVGLHEGFGMPALESLQYGVIPVVSNTTSLPEVVGDAGILVDPYNETSIMKGLDRALRLTQKERKDFHKKGEQQIKNFSWQASAEKLLKILTDEAIRSAQKK